mgnify:CR=1 FL=1
MATKKHEPVKMLRVASPTEEDEQLMTEFARGVAADYHAAEEGEEGVGIDPVTILTILGILVNVVQMCQNRLNQKMAKVPTPFVKKKLKEAIRAKYDQIGKEVSQKNQTLLATKILHRAKRMKAKDFNRTLEAFEAKAGVAPGPIVV